MNHEERINYAIQMCGVRSNCALRAQEIRELQAEVERLAQINRCLSDAKNEFVIWNARLEKERDALQAERDAALGKVNEQARLLGMRALREARLMAEVENLLVVAVAYGRHLSSCGVQSYSDCTCGFVKHPNWMETSAVLERK